jgi:tripartite-type tricarboxylate transporter receptor subunit TctC
MAHSVRSLVLLVVAVLIWLPGISNAEYPDRAINMIVAFAPGGGTDVAARALVPYLEKHIGGNAKIVVLNRAGAGGEIGFTALASALADGYTIGFINSPSVLTIPIEHLAQYTWQRFDLLGNVVDDPASFAVHSETAIRNLADLAAYARANPGALSVGTPGVGSPGHLAILMFAKLAGARVNHIPFKGAGDVRAPLAGKQIVLGAISVGEALQAMKGGIPLRTIAQMSPARTTLAPDLATAKEQGYELEMSSLRGLAAPKGLPANVRERLVEAVERVAADPDFKAKAVQFYLPLRYLSPAQFETALREGDAQFRRLWKETPWSER